jgi:hypothetical protein
MRLAGMRNPVCPGHLGHLAESCAKRPNLVHAQLALFLQLVSNAEHWAGRTADNPIRVGSQPTELFVQNASTD